MLEDKGVPVVDADVLARDVVAPGSPGLAEVLQRFPDAAAPDGSLDRSRLATRVFGDPGARTALNALLHPRIAEAFGAARAEHAARGTPVLVYDAALLIENGAHALLDGVVLVTVPRETQIARLVARDGLTREAAEARLAAQWSLQKKLPYATWQIDNSGTLEETRAQVDRVYEGMRAWPAPT
jgi:dephospho-CoA kinase